MSEAEGHRYVTQLWWQGVPGCWISGRERSWTNPGPTRDHGLVAVGSFLLRVSFFYSFPWPLCVWSSVPERSIRLRSELLFVEWDVKLLTRSLAHWAIHRQTRREIIAATLASIQSSKRYLALCLRAARHRFLAPTPAAARPSANNNTINK